MALDDLNSQNYGNPQSDHQPQPPTIASATTIAPTHWMTFITGTTNIAQITAPVSGAHELVLIFTNASPPQLTTTGNIKVGTTTAVQNVPCTLFYNPVEAKYYVNKGSV